MAKKKRGGSLVRRLPGGRALGARRGRASPRRPLRRRRSVRTSWRRAYSTDQNKVNSTKKSGRRGANARKHNLNIREVAKKEGEVHEYEVFLCTRDWSRMARLQAEITSWVKNCFSSRYKIYRHRAGRGGANVINSIKLESEGDLMMFMLCHREHVRKIFKMVNEPLGAHLH